MNNRIKELAEQAGFIGEIMNPVVGTSQETALENFAELIIKECAEKIHHNENLNWLNAAQAAKDLKKHFGVE